VFDFEWVHFGYNIGLELALVMLWRMYRSAPPWRAASARPVGLHALTVLIVFQGCHSIEHIIKLTQYLFVPLFQSGKVPTPGLLPQVTGWPIFLVHFGFNMIVWTLMLLAL